MEKKLLYRKRDFLNKEKFHSLAAVYGEIIAEWNNKSDKEKGKPPVHESIAFNISDCVRRIDIQFDTNNEEEWENSIEKIEKLESFVSEFKQHLYELRDMTKERVKNKKEDLTDRIYNHFSEWFKNHTLDGRIVEFEIEKDKKYFLLFLYNLTEKEILNDKFFTELKMFTDTIQKKYQTQIKISVD